MKLATSLRVNSIFIRVYLHMLIAMLVVILLSVLATSLINHVRLEQYREQLASGTFFLLAKGWQRAPEAEKRTWLMETARAMDLELSITTPEQAGMDSWQQQRLAENRVLLLETGHGSELQVYRYLDNEQTLLVSARIPRLSEQHARASVQLLRQTILVTGEPVAHVLADKEAYFHYQLNLISPSEVHLARLERAQLKEGETVLTFTENGRSVVAYAQLDDHQLLRVGPVELFNPYPVFMLTGIALVALILSASGVYLSIRALEQRLQKVEQAASRIAAGHLNTHVRVTGDDFVARLASAFNSMTRQVQELLRTQQEMIHAVSHELRTPVARIRFGMQMIEDLAEDPFIRKQLKGVDNDIQELDELVDEILTYARLGQETLKLHYEHVQVMPLIQDVVDGLKILKPELELNIVYLSPEHGDTAEIEVRYFQRAVQNLVSNACRYADSQVRISCYTEADSLRVDVEDDGPGIPEADWDRVFTPFSRLDDSRTRETGGYGLGLSIVRRITYWHQGSAMIDASDDLGGARFSLVFPRFRAELIGHSTSVAS